MFCCNHTCNCVKMVSVTSVLRYITPASRYYPRNQSRSSMYIRGLIQRNFVELAEAVRSRRSATECWLGSFVIFKRCPYQSNTIIDFNNPLSKTSNHQVTRLIGNHQSEDLYCIPMKKRYSDDTRRLIPNFESDSTQ